MKASKYILATGLAALVLTTVSHGQTVIRITGSTAYRGATVSAIGKIFDNNSFTLGYVGSAPTGVAANFRGNVNGVDVLIKTSFSGSEAGVQTVSFGATPLTVKFLPDTTVLSAGISGQNPGSAPTGGTGSATDPTTTTDSTKVSAEIPDVALADTFQSSSVFRGTYRGKFYPTLTEAANSPVGVVPFTFVASKSAPAGVTNITSQLAQALFSAGRIKLSLFTGNSADTTNVLATGRDPDSGTRLTALAEVGLGAAFGVKQYQPANSGDTAITTAGNAVDHATPWPASTVNTIPVPVFQGGYPSGGQLANALGNTTDLTNLPIRNAAGTVVANGGFFVSYASTGDAKTAVTNGAHYLGYNGVNLYNNDLSNAAISANFTPIYEGQYTFWGFEHVYYRAGAVGTTVAAVGDRLASQLLNTDATVLLGNMKVTRTGDGSTVQ